MRAHYNALYDYGMKLSGGDEDFTKDCIQEVFLTFWNCRDNWHSLQSVRAYLLVSLRNRVIDAQRRTRRSGRVIRLTDSEGAVYDIPDLSFSDDTEQTHRLTALLDKLPPRQREAVYLRYFAEMDYADIADAMGVKERTVYNLVHQGLQQLRQTVASSPSHQAELLLSILFFLEIF
ncbi:DNA-directed RNA polymerase sigma-70 factor [Persicitalea jodogahamensis]|uniref:DNA-directed RNA polymerase sigma-70 factor n=2 Tax=Persicitalea jodogahamensis TaxID=402147 RepID=A0A8J3DDP4_9BACT|nr:DNA-directed RNA polymerase sigma-70 factor [Persicitalea jodogahamensis]